MKKKIHWIIGTIFLLGIFGTGYITDHHIYLLGAIRENNRHMESFIQDLNEKIKHAI